MIVHASTLKYKKSSIFGRLSFDDLPPECQTPGSLCGSIGTSTGPCALYHVKGCPLRHRIEVAR